MGLGVRLSREKEEGGGRVALRREEPSFGPSFPFSRTFSQFFFPSMFFLRSSLLSYEIFLCSFGLSFLSPLLLSFLIFWHFWLLPSSFFSPLFSVFFVWIPLGLVGCISFISDGLLRFRWTLAFP